MRDIAKMIIPAVAGGLVISVLGFIPIVNYLCCLYVPLGGLVSAALLKMMGKGEKLESNDGIVAGGLAGVVAALIYAAVNVLVMFLLVGMQVGFGALASANSQTIEPLLAFGTAGILQVIIMGAIAVAFVLLYLAVYVGFGAIGGAVGASLLYKKE